MKNKVLEFVKSKNFMIGIVVVLSAVAIFLTTFGVLTHKEPGFMARTAGWEKTDFPLQVCAQAYTDLGFNDPGMTCESSDNASCDSLGVVADAVATTNARLGFVALKPAGEHCDITVTVGVPSESGWTDAGGNAILTPKQCLVETSNVHGQLRDLVVQHELGHCLGLDHDDYALSIMYGGGLRETAARTIPPWITDYDRGLIRSMALP